MNRRIYSQTMNDNNFQLQPILNTCPLPSRPAPLPAHDNPHSPLGWSVWGRLAWAAGASILLWLAVAWAIGW
ncbi:MAG: hypothetical protein HQK55_05950 [Deltaproteobacteria bacterium]|nr:hypothetical protein [Deltaproteobacteria bacterium]